MTDSGQKIKELFDTHFYHLVLHAVSYTNDYNQSEEIVQDVFVKVWQNMEQIGHVSDFKAYLYKAVGNSSLNYLRHLKIRQKHLEEVVHINDHFENPAEESMMETENNIRVHQAVNKLPENWKEAIILSKYENLKYHEIAEMLQEPLGTIKSRIHFARKLLKSQIQRF